jgi:hypothetical protein
MVFIIWIVCSFVAYFHGWPIIMSMFIPFYLLHIISWWHAGDVLNPLCKSSIGHWIGFIIPEVVLSKSNFLYVVIKKSVDCFRYSMFLAFAEIRGKIVKGSRFVTTWEVSFELLSRFILNNLNLISIVDNTVINTVGKYKHYTQYL